MSQNEYVFGIFFFAPRIAHAGLSRSCWRSRPLTDLPTITWITTDLNLGSRRQW